MMAGTKVAIQELGTKQFLPPCRVCGDKAAGFHYGVNTCEACKGFFHRSLRRYKEYKCRANRTTGYCEYKPGKRKSCQYCRYQRCLNAGMSKDAIKTGRYTYTKRTEDTQEIKRMQDQQYGINSDIKDENSSDLSSSFHNLSTKRCYTSDCYNNGCYSDTFMDENFAVSNGCDSSSLIHNDSSFLQLTDLSSTQSHALTKSLIFEHAKSHTKSNRYGCQNNQPKLTKATSLSSNKLAAANSSKLSSYNDHTSYTHHKHLNFEKCNFSVSEDSENDQKLCNLSPEAEVATFMDFADFPLASHTLLEVVDQIQTEKNSVIHILLSNDNEDGHVKDISQRNKLDNLQTFIKKEQTDLNLNAKGKNAAQALEPTVGENHNTSIKDSFMISCLKSTELGSKESISSTFDLFPDISFCLEGQPLSSSATSLMSDVMEPSSVLMTSSCFLSPMASQSPHSNMSSVSSPGMVVLNMDSGKRQKVDANLNMITNLCDTPESNFMEQDEMMLNEDSITSKIMEDYTHGFDFMAHSPQKMQTPTSVQTLLTTPSPHHPSSGSSSPLLDPGGLNSDHNTSLTSKYLNRAEKLQVSDITELYSDTETIITILVASHKKNIGTFNFLPKEEMKAQQEAHYESCQLKKQTFGDLGFLPDQEYDDIYSATGIDVDNRRMLIQKFLARMERCVRGLVLFAKAIPGFSLLDINTQVELIKLSRSEIAIFTMYPSVNLELGVSLGISGEHWTCFYDMGKSCNHLAITEYMILCDKLQKLDPTEEEEVLLKAILVATTDRDNSVQSPLAESIQWHLVLCLKHILEKHREQPGLVLARYILLLAQSRTVGEKLKDFVRQLKIEKYSSIEQNPLMWELFSGILQEKEAEYNWEKLCQHLVQEKFPMWSPCLLG